MRLPPIDLSDIMTLLRKEGTEELSALHSAQSGKLLNILHLDVVLKEWNNILRIIDTEIVPKLARGCDAGELVVPAKQLMTSAGALSIMASEVLSFIPGPIGIVCSLINAIVCFSTGNVVGGFLELLGCIPGAKAGVKGGSKLFSKFNSLVIEALQKNKKLKDFICKTAEGRDKLSKFFKKSEPKIGPQPSSKISGKEVGLEYGVREESALERSLKTPLRTQTPPPHSPVKPDRRTQDSYIRSQIDKYRLYGGLGNPLGNIFR